MLMMEFPRDDEGDLRWKMRAKRSQPTPPPPPSLDGFTDDDIAAAEALVLLARSGGGFCIPDADSAIFFPPKKRRGVPSPSAFFAAVDAVTASADTTTPAPAAVHAAETATPAPAAANGKSREEVSPVSPLPKYFHHCWVCGQVFHSSQALGGHMTSHRAKIETAAIAEDAGHRSHAAAARGRVHKCSLCHETFATGQALGGHKRKHYDGPALVRKALKFAPASSPAVSEETSRGGGDTSNDRPVLPFDLNLPPPPEE